VRPSYREKESLYRGLGQLLKSGIPFPTAVEKLAQTSHGSVRHSLERMHAAVSSGQTVAEAFEKSAGFVTPLDASVVAALERSGRLDHGFQQLAEYYAALAKARSTILRQSAYPLFILHLGILMLGVPTLVAEGVQSYLAEVGWTIGITYAAAIVLALLFRSANDAAAVHPATDRFLRMIPLIGKVRRSFALARFCFVYDIQLEAGINVIDALLTAARAGRSGMIRSAVDTAIPRIRAGESVGLVLAASDAFPREMIRDLQVAESVGGLDRELPRLARHFQEDALGRLTIVAEWLAKLLYFAVVLYLAWRIISFYIRYFGAANRILEG
jgi:type IV pilus assembly protein PilC